MLLRSFMRKGQAPVSCWLFLVLAILEFYSSRMVTQVEFKTHTFCKQPIPLPPLLWSCTARAHACLPAPCSLTAEHTFRLSLCETLFGRSQMP